MTIEEMESEWKRICIEEGLELGTPEYAERAEQFFEEIYMESVTS